MSEKKNEHYKKNEFLNNEIVIKAPSKLAGMNNLIGNVWPTRTCDVYPQIKRDLTKETGRDI